MSSYEHNIMVVVNYASEPCTPLVYMSVAKPVKRVQTRFTSPYTHAVICVRKKI
jgi:hypothetical protein